MLAQLAEDLTGHAQTESHLPAYRRHHGDVFRQADGIGLHLLLDLTQNAVQTGGNLGGLHHQRNGVDTGGRILHVDLVLGQNGQQLQQGTGLRGHAALGDGDDGKALLPGNTGDEAVVLRFIVDAAEDHGAVVGGIVGVADVQGDILLPYREHRALMKHLRAQIAQLPQLAVCHPANGRRVLHDAGVRHQDAGHVCPVLVHVGVQRRRRQRAGDIAAAPGQSHHSAVRHGAVETGDHHPLAVRRLAQGLIAGLLIHGAVKLELQPQGRVQKGIAQILRHQPGGEVLPPGGQILLIRLAGAHPLPQGVKLPVQVQSQPAVIGDLLIPLADQGKDLLTADAVFQVGAAQIQQIRDLMILLIPFTGGGHHDDAAGRIAFHNGLHFGKLHGIRHGGAAEFCYF